MNAEVMDVSGAPATASATPSEGHARTIGAMLPDNLDTLFVVGSGSEANDLALRIARSATGGKGIVITRHAFHGTTVETAAISPAIGGVAVVAGWARLVDPPVGDGQAFTAAVRTAAYELRDSEYGFGALILDSVFVSDGVHPAAGLGEAIDAVHDAGGLVIVDETGLVPASVGPTMWAFDGSDITPDIFSFAVSAPGAAPVAIVAMNSQVEYGPAIEPARFRGTDAALEAAEAFLSDIRTSDSATASKSVGDYLAAGLALVASAGGSITAVRGRGLHVAIDTVRASELFDACAEHRVLLGRAGSGSLVISAPLGFTMSDADVLLGRMYGAIISLEAPA